MANSNLQRYRALREELLSKQAADAEQPQGASQEGVGDGSLPADVKAYMDEYAKVAASGMSEVDYYADQRNKALEKIKNEAMEYLRNNGVDVVSPQGQQLANMYMQYAMENSIDYQNFNNLYNQAYTQQQARNLENQTRAEQQKIKDFSNAMQQIDPVTGMPLSDMNMQSALDDARQSWNKFSGAISGAANEAKNNYADYNQYRKDNNLRWWENADGFAQPNG